ncbi:MAG: hypothetical protein AAFY15_16890, partial [Cyanobacteria bacterium J06648_11]
MARMEFDFGTERTLTAIQLHWSDVDAAEAFAYDIHSVDGDSTSPLGGVVRSTGGRDLVWLGESDVSRLSLQAQTEGLRVPELKRVEFIEPSDIASPNDLLRRIAVQSAKHEMPPAFHDIHTSWTASGAPGHSGEAIVSLNGRVEFDKAGASLEPFMVYDAGDTVGWSEAVHKQTLVDGYLPIPIVERDDGATTLQVTTLSIGDAERSSCVIEYAVTNETSSHLDASLVLTVRPLQVLPHWQWLNVTGGFSPLRDIRVSKHVIGLNAGRPIFLTTPADDVMTWDMQDSALPVAEGDWTGEPTHAVQRRGFAAAAVRYDLSLARGETMRVLVEA